MSPRGLVLSLQVDWALADLEKSHPELNRILFKVAHALNGHHSKDIETAKAKAKSPSMSNHLSECIKKMKELLVGTTSYTAVDFGEEGAVYRVCLRTGKDKKPTEAAIKLYAHPDQAEMNKLMKREHEAYRFLLAKNPRLGETSHCYVCMQLDTPFTEKHGQCSVLSYLPYSWADVLDQDDCVLPYAVVKAQFKIIFVTLVAIHDAGVAHCNLEPSAVRLSQGLIPHIVGFEHSWNQTRKGTKDDRIHSEATYYPVRLAGNNLKSDGLKGFTLYSMQLLDLYAYAAMMVQAFFEVVLTEDGHLDAVQSLKFDKVRERYRNQIDKNQFELLRVLVNFIIEQVQADNTCMKAEVCLMDQWFKDVPIDKSRRYSHIA